jgi:hypothetical protein
MQHRDATLPLPAGGNLILFPLAVAALRHRTGASEWHARPLGVDRRKFDYLTGYPFHARNIRPYRRLPSAVVSLRRSSISFIAASIWINSSIV